MRGKGCTGARTRHINEGEGQIHMKHISANTWTRTILLVTALINQVLTMLNKNPIPVSEEEIYSLLTAAFTVGTSLWNWWKNNSFTKEAVKADAYLDELKGREGITQ